MPVGSTFSPQIPLSDKQSTDPPADGGFYYLVTPVNFNGEGLLGPRDALPPRTNDEQCP